MEIEKKKIFIINCAYFGILALFAFFILKYCLPMLSPFVAAFLIAYLLRRPIRFLARKTHISQKICAIFVVLVFYGIIFLLLFLLGAKTFSATKPFIMSLPSVYALHIQPVLLGIFSNIEASVLQMDPSLLAALEEMWNHFVQSIGQMVSSLSVWMMGLISGFATFLPGLFIKLLLMFISSFFIAADYELIIGFFMRQLNGRSREMFILIKEYIVDTLFVCIRSYALIMSITFVELSIGLSLIGIKNAILIALSIAIFDILPVLGTGGIMIPWAVIEVLQKNYALALGLLIVYIAVTVIRNILEPKIVGSRIGLHPVLTLASMFVGAQLFGVLGLFGFPIVLSLLRHLNENGKIKLYRATVQGEKEP